ncbi:thiamine pyrophosphate-requiring protein [Roseomonas populi]|uniref:Thiamine pyrophosphate-requiring protein n=1 Tax=Roseomonas populi TaxID=3121582 RepID=A0ABT1WZB6_9PROT|nr:thiamine pyrophosphate-requiring protein [Roseomonas pecuniae]MCR0981187.1 thiamine pyrophosphate-requiring protein [Roseomonas pecuniae]
MDREHASHPGPASAGDAVAPIRPMAAEVFLAALAEHGVDKFFLNPGTDFAPIVEAYSAAGRKNPRMPDPVLVTHENTAVTMAHGYFLATGRAQAVMVHVSVGTANTINAIADASRDNVPVLLCAGRSPVTEVGAVGTRNRHIHWAQEMFDQAGMLREWVKWDYELRNPSQVADVVDRAFEVMDAAPRRPVYLTLPREPLAASVSEGTAVNARRGPPRKPHPDPADIETLAGWLADASSPLIVTAGMGRTAEDVATLAAFAERFAVPIVTYNPRQLCLPTDHPMHAGFDPGPLVPKADLILAIESDVPWTPSLVRPAPGTRIVHVGEDPAWQRYPMRSFPSDLSITADAAVTLARLHRAAEEQIAEGDLEARRFAMAETRAARLAAAAAKARPKGSVITPEYLSHAIGEALGDATIVNEYPLRLDHCSRTRPGSYFQLGPAGGLGWSLGAALGIKLADPGRLVVCTIGDGAYMFANPSASHWTAQVHDLPVLTIVFNNERYGAVRGATMSMYAKGAAGADDGRFLADLASGSRWDKVVEAHGGYGERVEDAAELPAALARARRAVEEGRQALLDVICPY